MIAPLAYVRPERLDEALALLSEFGSDARPIAGGTALAILMKQQLVRPNVLVALDGIEELRLISKTDDGVCIGATATHREVELSPLVSDCAPLLTRTLGHVATIRIRNAGTLGGNVAHADPSQDPPATLIALGATLTLVGPDGRRVVPVDEFFVDYYETALREGELLTAIDVPSAPAGTGISSLKFLPRSADDYATVSVAVALRVDGKGLCTDVRVGLASVAAVPIRARHVEEALLGHELDSATIDEAAAAVRDEIDPISDGRGSAEYKREMARVFVARAVREAVGATAGHGA